MVDNIRIPGIFSCKLKGLLIEDVGVSRGTLLREIRPGADFETGDVVKEKLGLP